MCKRIGDIFESEGSDAWFKRSPQDFLGNDYKMDDYDQVKDIVDVWFESGSTHQFVLPEHNLPWPADLYLEGSDQHRGWFHSSLLESCGTTGRAPYKAVLTHGFVLDEKGMKMSKSLGNVVSPQEVMKEYGADILRLWTITSNYAEDIRVGGQILKTTTDMYRRIRNTLRYLLGALDGFNASEQVDLSDPSELPELEQYMLHRLAVLNDQIKTSIDNYEFGKMAGLVYTFCNSDLSSFYFDIRKDRLYCDRLDSMDRRAYRSVMAAIFESLCAWLAPVLAFTAEESWSFRPRGVFKDDADSIHLKIFADVPAKWRNDSLVARWEEAMKVRDAVLKSLEEARNAKLIGSALEAHPVISMPHDLPDFDWAEICITSQATTKIGELSVAVNKAAGTKCERCWKILPDVKPRSEFGGMNLSDRDFDAVQYFIKNSKQQAA